MMYGLSDYLKANPLFLCFLIAHFLADYQLQSPKMAELKSQRPDYLLKHIGFVGITLLPILIIFPSSWLANVIIVISHALIDGNKAKIANYLTLNKSQSFLLDQALHLLIIFGISLSSSPLTIPNWLSREMLTAILFLVLITKPSNIIFKILFEKYQPEEVVRVDTIAGAGAMIGTLERIVIGVCMIMGQFASIGLVFTAKSIARYNKISESPAFAEYYLIGSLFSILSVFLAFWICFC
ncbi:DUF3307 domain-containing protein [Streptococcus iniae]|uniref:Membrane protein n=2 Tax=Streptococcus iniae TaxID=1346 RepID=A0ABN4D7Z5_STRIN|nr:membrane protein [Streptococcus iniae]AHY17629.1 membrane protein [Streptococcus iniae]